MRVAPAWLRHGSILVALCGCVACQRVPPRPLAPDATAAALEARTLADPALAAFLTAALGAAPEQWPIRKWDLRTLTLAALYFQPSMDVARAHADVARAAVDSAAARPNPTLSFTPEYTTHVTDFSSPWLAAVHLDWTVETAGKREHRMERAEADAAGAQAAVLVEAWRLRRQLAGALASLAAARRQASTLGEEVSADQRLVALLDTRLQAGAVSASDVAPARFALLQSTTDRAAALAQSEEALARVAGAIGIPARALDSSVLPDGLDADAADNLLHVDGATARRRALLQRADVLQAVASYAAAEAALRLELARQYPDLHLGPGYQYDQGENKWSIGLAIDLPLLNRNEGPIAEAVAGRDEAGAKVLATQADAIAEVEQALARRSGEAARVASVRAAVDDRARQLARARGALAAGAADRAAVVSAEVEQTRASRLAADADASLAQALIDLDAAIAGPLPPAALETPGAAFAALRAADGQPQAGTR
jgi:outer membrane protein TolC